MTQDAPMSNFSNVGTSSEETPRENGGPDKLNTEWILVSCFQSYRETPATPALGGLWGRHPCGGLWLNLDGCCHQGGQ